VPPDETRVPVVVSTGQSIERNGTVSALELAERAARESLAAAPGLGARVQLVSVVNVMSKTGPAPAADLARRLGLAPARTEVTTLGGNSPQWLLNRAADAISTGALHGALVAGAEAQRSAKVHRAKVHGAQSTDHRPDSGDGADAGEALAPDPVVGDDRAGVGAAELNVGLVAPVHVYALFESVLARRAGRAPAQQRAALGALMARFTEVAAQHPTAWFPEKRSATELSTVTPDNRLVAEPYPKRMCAFLNVDQGAAVLVTSLAAARAAGVADRAVFCWSGAEAADVWFPSARPDLGSSPGLRAATSAAFSAAHLGVDDIDALDLYSCFPCAVEMAVEALGIATDDTRGFTVTGGLPYFGGPGNNYSLHAIATMVDHLRERGGTGLVSALGWYATKHAVGIYGAAPSPAGWHGGDTAEAQRAIDASAVAVAMEAHDRAEVVASTVVAGPDGAVSAAPVIARLPDGRQIAAAAAPGELSALAGRNLVGDQIEVSGAPPRYRVLD
jgi:acetyl-CoA C-acetyltransferase